MPRTPFVSLPSICLSLAGLVCAEPSASDLEFFEKRIRPVLSTHCYKCHSVDARKLKADLRLDSRQAMLRGGDSGPSIVPGRPDESLLIETVRYANVDLQMPPKNPLDEQQVADLEEWVRRGAPWPDEPAPAAGGNREQFDLEARRDSHWCWQPVARVKPPTVEDEDWPLDPIDRFILAKLEEVGLCPAEDADRRTWIRRASFDLRGLPPTPEEVEAFLADASPEAHERVVDRYLASPDYGVKWGRHWLDLVRYAESYGHEFDYDIPEAWKYRDHVVRAFNGDVAHDRMIREAIAGDLLSDPRRDPATGLNESVTATGFWWLGEATHAPTDVRGDEAVRMDNQIDVLSKSFLGLTVSCARCHDHKFDAISDEDFYSLSGYLQSSRRALVPRDPRGRIAEAAGELRGLQRSATEMAGLPVVSEVAEVGADSLWSFDEGSSLGWLRDGAAFPEAPTSSDRREVALLPDSAELVPPGVWHSGLYGRPLHGVLRSPTFTIEGSEIHFLLKATGRVSARVVIDGYFMADFNALLFKGTSLRDGELDTQGEWQWRSFGGDLRKYVGHRAYLEFVDQGEGYIAIGGIGYARGETPAAPVPLAAPEGLAAVMDQAQAIWAKLPAPDYVLGMREGTAENDRLHIRGGHKNLGEELPRRFLTALGGRAMPDDAATGSGRLELADAVVSPDNPLTARVQVNRLWHHLMGRGLVPTVDDFGVMGEAPSHPELLDWMATRFVESGWSNKQMIRSIVLSRSYRMSCVPHPDLSPNKLAEIDPTNTLLHAFRVKRLSSEAIRDAILAVSGRIDPARGGPPVDVHLTSFMEGRGRPKSGPLDGAGRRSIYTAVRRNFLPPFHLAFDYPIPFSTMGRRSSSNVPAQSLVLMNDPFVAAEARRWATDLLEESDRGKRLELAFVAALSRPPEDEERAILGALLERQAELHGADPDDLAVWADLTHLLFNKKEFIFIR